MDYTNKWYSLKARLESLSDHKSNGNNQGLCEIELSFFIKDNNLIGWQRPKKTPYEPKSFDYNDIEGNIYMEDWQDVIGWLRAHTQPGRNNTTILVQNSRPVGVIPEKQLTY